MVIEVTSTPASSQTIYLLHDHLGSTDVITDASGNVETRYSFDAWGARRNVTWAAYFPTMPAVLWQTALTTRGFTGHEELDEVGLVHMNGRVYDPQLGRFLSADPVVQDATDLQAFNHYAYVRNNPLSLLDPSGFSWIGDIFKSIGNFFSHAFGGIASAMKAMFKNAIFRAVIQIAACAFGGPIGCVAAAGVLALAAGGSLHQAMEAMAFTMLSVGTWSAVGSALQGAGAVMQSGFDMTRILVHGVVQGALTAAQGGHFMNGFAIGAAGEGADVAMKEAGLNGVPGDEGRYMRAMIAGAAGGTASALTGGNFANGAVSAAFAHLFNEENEGKGEKEEKGLDTNLDRSGPFRIAEYEATAQKIKELDPGNGLARYWAADDWVPSDRDLDLLRAELARVSSFEFQMGRAIEDAVPHGGTFRGITGGPISLSNPDPYFGAGGYRYYADFADEFGNVTNYSVNYHPQYGFGAIKPSSGQQ